MFLEMTQGQSKESKIAHSQKNGQELRTELSKMLAIKKKTNTKNQRHARDYHNIQMAGSQ